jgi:hypothetical protein
MNSRTRLVDSVINFPCPILDRDSVIESVFETIKLGDEYQVTMRAQPNILALVEGRVRISYSKTCLLLQWSDVNTTSIEYGLEADCQSGWCGRLFNTR